MYKYEERKRNMIDLKILQQDPRVVISRQLFAFLFRIIIEGESVHLCSQ